MAGTRPAEGSLVAKQAARSSGCAVGPRRKPADQPVEVVDDLVQEIVQSRRDAAARVSEPLLQLVNERRQFIQTHAARGSLEGMKAPR